MPTMILIHREQLEGKDIIVESSDLPHVDKDKMSKFVEICRMIMRSTRKATRLGLVCFFAMVFHLKSGFSR